MTNDEFVAMDLYRVILWKRMTASGKAIKSLPEDVKARVNADTAAYRKVKAVMTEELRMRDRPVFHGEFAWSLTSDGIGFVRLDDWQDWYANIIKHADEVRAWFQSRAGRVGPA